MDRKHTYFIDLIENKRDVVEFDSSNGKIISISFKKNLSKNKFFHSIIIFEDKNKKRN